MLGSRLVILCRRTAGNRPSLILFYNHLQPVRADGWREGLHATFRSIGVRSIQDPFFHPVGCQNYNQEGFSVHLKRPGEAVLQDRKSVVEGKRGDLGGGRIIKKKKKKKRRSLNQPKTNKNKTCNNNPTPRTTWFTIQRRDYD